MTDQPQETESDVSFDELAAAEEVEGEPYQDYPGTEEQEDFGEVMVEGSESFDLPSTEADMNEGEIT